MTVTGIAADNAEYFEGLAYEGAFEREDILWLGAADGDGTACTILGAGIYGEMAYIEWIYTEPSYRRKGAGRALLKWLKTLLRKADAKILQISFPEMDEEDSLEEFLEAEGFFLEEDRETYSVPVKDLIYSEKLDEYQEGHRSSGRVVTLSELEKKDDFHAYIAEKEIPFEAEADRLSQSLVRINKEGKIDGCMLIFLRPDGDLEISYLSSTPAEGDVFELIMALQDLLLRMDDWREENILFTDRTGEIAGLIEELTGESSASYIATGKKEGILLL